MSRALPDDLELRPFSVAEARRRGVDLARLRRTDLRSDFHGTRISRFQTDDFENLCRAYATRLGPHRYFSHETAAVLWRMRLPLSLETSRILHVTAVRPARTPRTRGVVGHHVEIPEHDLVEHRGFLLPSPADTWRMLATRLDVEGLVIAGDGLVSRKHPLVSLARLRRALARNAGRRGNARLRAAFEQIRVGTDSPRETRTRLMIVLAGLPEPLVNVVVSRPGDPRRVGDLVYREWKVLIEYEGAHHQESRKVYLSDIDRYDQLLRDGWNIVRIAKEHTPAHTLARIRSALLAAGWRP